VSETSPVPPQAIEDLNLKITKKDAKKEGPVKGMVGAGERQIGLGRFSKSKLEGVAGFAQNAVRFVGSEVGFGQDGRELSAYDKYVSGQSKENMGEEFDEKMGGKSREEQISFMSGELESMKDILSQLMDTRADSPELSKGVVGDALKKLDTDLRDANQEDKEFIESFFKDMKEARGELMSAVGMLWDVQGSQDDLSKVKQTLDLGDRDIAAGKGHRHEASGSTIKKVASFFKRLPRVPNRIGQALKTGGEVSVSDVTFRLNELRTKALVMGSDEEDVELWRAGIVSTKKLANIDAASLNGVDLTPEENQALQDGTELFADENGKFELVSEAIQHEELQKFFDRRLASAQTNFEDSREKYLNYDLGDMTEDTIPTVVGVSGDLMPAPAALKEFIGKTVGQSINGVLTMGKSIEGGLSFGVDHMESAIAGEALEKTAAVALMRDKLIGEMEELLKTGASEEELKQKALQIRGMVTVNSRTALYAGRAVDSINMTQEKDLLPSLGWSVAEIAKAGVEKLSGGLFVGESAGKVLTELVDQAKNSLDGKQLVNNTMDEIGELGQDGREYVTRGDVGNEVIEGLADEFKVPEEYRTKEAMEEELSGSGLFAKAVEKFRKQIGPEGEFLGIGKLLNFKDQQWWQIVAGGSRRVDLETVKDQLSSRLQLAGAGIELKTDQLQADDNQNKEKTAIELSTLLVLQDAQKRFAKSEVRQIATRSKLDKMWKDVFGISTAAGALGVLSAAFGALGVPVSTWAESAKLSAQSAANELGNMKEAFDAISDIANQYQQDFATTGGKWQMFWQNAEVALKNAGSGIASGVDTAVPLAALTAKVAAISAPVVAGLRQVAGLGTATGAKSELFEVNEDIK
jgi:hypothetical protein